MIAVDTNILVYAHREESPFHERAVDCLRALSEGSASWAIPWPCVHEFYSIVTHPRIFDPPSPVQAGLAQIDAWFASPTLVLLSETSDYWATLKRITTTSKVSGPLIHDARIVVLCMQNGVSELLTADRDFGRFGDLKTRNPLVSG